MKNCFFNLLSQAPVLLVRNLRKEFPKTSDMCKRPSNKVKVAVCNISFAVEAGEVFGLLGPNGAGKTTTLNMIIAEEGSTTGEVRRKICSWHYDD